MSDPKQEDPDSNGHAPPWQRERRPDPDPIPLARLRDREDWPAQRKLDETVDHLRAAAGRELRTQSRELRTQKQSDVFAEAVAKAMQAQLGPEYVEAPSVLQHRHSSGVARWAIAAAVAAIAALVFVVGFPAPQQGPAEQNASAAEPTSPSIWQSLKSSLSRPPQRNPVPTLVVRDSTGFVNQPLSLGVSVASPGPGAIVVIDKMPASAMLTFGRRISTSEWRVPAQDVSEVSIIPPRAFVGTLNLTAELRGADGAALVSSFVRPTWTSAGARPDDPVVVSAATAPSLSIAPQQQQQLLLPQPQQQLLPQPQQQQILPQAPPAAARADAPVREIDAREVAGFIGRAQDLLSTGDLQAARLFLLRAAEAHDARAALLLAKTFDPVVSKQFGATDAQPDLARARNWYQKAEEWGAPEAKRELDALASYPAGKGR